ncbi:lactate racemase domain-containing protein [Georgenia sp. SUBG003]|uniref:lactate racemase domain-containing protein n=1 Tax=Georgenia sp. SUBG003 TaxID=1497974 RepID=UPI003AB21FB7
MLNHEWWKPETFADLGTIPAEEVARYSGGRLTDRPMHVIVNRAVVEHDVSLVVGPVLPHEVVGMSGGQVLLPRAVGSRRIDMSHWVGGAHLSFDIIGTVASRRCGP